MVAPGGFNAGNGAGDKAGDKPVSLAELLEKIKSSPNTPDPIPPGATYEERIAYVILDMMAMQAAFKAAGHGMSLLAYEDAIQALSKLPGVGAAMLKTTVAGIIGAITSAPPSKPTKPNGFGPHGVRKP